MESRITLSDRIGVAKQRFFLNNTLIEMHVLVREQGDDESSNTNDARKGWEKSLEFMNDPELAFSFQRMNNKMHESGSPGADQGQQRVPHRELPWRTRKKHNKSLTHDGHTNTCLMSTESLISETRVPNIYRPCVGVLIGGQADTIPTSTYTHSC